MAWAVFFNGKRVSKVYPLREQAVTDAVERGYAFTPGMEGWAIGMKDSFFEGVEIREVEDNG